MESSAHLLSWFMGCTGPPYGFLGGGSSPMKLGHVTMTFEGAAF